MMKLKKKVATAALASTMVAMMAAPAFAAPADSTQKDFDGASSPFVTNTVTDGTAADNSTVITGTIKPTTISVTVPTVGAFNIDPFTAALDPTTQIAYSANYAITNRTVGVPVYAAVTNLKVDSATSISKADVKLTNDKAEVGTTAGVPKATNKVMFTVKKTGLPAADGAQPADFDVPAEWLLDDATITTDAPFFVDQAGADSRTAYTTSGFLGAATSTVDDTDPDNPVITVTPGVDGVVSMGFYGQAKADATWIAGEKFTVTPTFTIKVDPWSNTPKP